MGNIVLERQEEEGEKTRQERHVFVIVRVDSVDFLLSPHKHSVGQTRIMHFSIHIFIFRGNNQF